MKLEQKIENREKNLLLHYESVRKDLDIILTSTIPNQKNLMKTILWLNASILGAILTQYKTLPCAICLLPSIAFSFFSLLLILYSLKTGQVKSFGQANIDEIENFSDEFERISGISFMMFATREAFEHNLNIIERRAKKISKATTFTLVSLIIIMLYGIIAINIKLH